MPYAPAPDPDQDPIGALEHEIRIVMRRVNSFSGVLARLVHPELEASAYPLLAHILANPGTRGSDLAAHFGVGRATISRQLARLEQLGLISRAPDPDDSRGQILTLTAAGEAGFTAARQGRVGHLNEALAGWKPDDVAQLARLLHRYSADMVRWHASHTA